MKTALILTTINVPKVLALYRRLGPEVRFFVAGDLKTPDEAAMGSDEPHYMSSDYQKSLGYKCSELLGWNNDSRRNIALLEAVRWGAEIIVSTDDDMIPISPDFFERMIDALTLPWSGLQIGDEKYWIDVGQFTIPPAPQRGLPAGWQPINNFSIADSVQIGAMQGVILGVPDTDAMTAMTKRPVVLSATDVLREGFVVNPKSYAVFNSQITAFRRELAPCFAQFYKWQGRNTDIFASLVMRRVMREFGLHTYFGPPFGFHARSLRDPLLDLKAEMFGLERVVDFAGWLETYVYTRDDKMPLEATRRIYSGMSEHILPRENIDCALAFLDDMESVL